MPSNAPAEASLKRRQNSNCLLQAAAEASKGSSVGVGVGRAVDVGTGAGADVSASICDKFLCASDAACGRDAANVDWDCWDSPVVGIAVVFAADFVSVSQFSSSSSVDDLVAVVVIIGMVPRTIK